MISVILYGRNDNYGYNLHKRAALSLNCIAEILDGPGDEIIFVDYNTPDDFPTFPEAIADTLTPTARRKLRILRVRPAQHRRFAARTHLVALEPIARNVALRRSNPANRWILSTNTDMIFTPRTADGLGRITGALPDGCYGLPRFELPESLWEALDRTAPAAAIDQVAAWGWDMHLNEVVTLAAVRFDAPGDFQLMLRKDLFRIHGFDERMLLGWHVDSNISTRLAMLHGEVGDLSEALFGYHCDHTRQVTPAHRPGSPQNDWETFVTNLDSPDAPGQEATWGLAGEHVEEIRLDTASLAPALRAAIGAPQAALTTLHYGTSSYDHVGYDARHVLPFLLDALISQSRDLRLGWFGAGGDLLHRLAIAWQAAGFTGPILLAADAPGPTPPAAVIRLPAEDIAEQADIFVFDFAPPDAAQRFAMAGLRTIAAAEAARRDAGLAPLRRLIAINAVHNRMDSTVHRIIAAATSPIATRIRQGFLHPDAVWDEAMAREATLRPSEAEFASELLTGDRVDLLPWLSTGTAGKRCAGGIDLVSSARGHIFYGPYIDPPPGDYRLELGFAPPSGTLPRPGALRIEVVAGDHPLASRVVLAHGLGAQSFVLDFTVRPGDTGPKARLEVRATARGRVRGAFTAAGLTRIIV